VEHKWRIRDEFIEHLPAIQFFGVWGFYNEMMRSFIDFGIVNFFEYKVLK
jgi:hypothetical protein